MSRAAASASLASLGREVPFESLGEADLIVDAVYKAGAANNLSSDPLNKLMRAGNAGGFRWRGRVSQPAYVVLFTTLDHPDWPDHLDQETGTFIYYGDNRTPGVELHEPDGNKILRNAFAALHDPRVARVSIPPFFVFAKVAGRDVRFCGLALPGAPGVSPTNDLVAVWRSSEGQRFQNYRATFTILDEARIPRSWIESLIAGEAFGSAPRSWAEWVSTGKVTPLTAPRTLSIRSKAEQFPEDSAGLEMIRVIHQYFADDSHGFEAFSAALMKLHDPNVVDCEVTRPWRDGGRDAIGRYRIGTRGDSILVDFALEAKCYAASSGVGVEDTSRLISRLRHRQFGVLVTTSYVAKQAYEEIREDGHPVIVLAARDIVAILKDRGLSDARAVDGWLRTNIPRGS